MATEKEFRARQQQKHDIAANWQKAGENEFIPKAGEIIVYDKFDKEGNRVADNTKIKIGDGITRVHELEFVSGEGAGGGSTIQFVVWGEND